MTVMYCGVKLTEWSDVKTSFGTIESRVYLNSYPLAKSLSIGKLVARNTKDEPHRELLLHSNSSAVRDISHKNVSMETSKRFGSIKTTAATDTRPTNGPGAAEIKKLYDSDLILSHGVKLQWIRHRMMA